MMFWVLGMEWDHLDHGILEMQGGGICEHECCFGLAMVQYSQKPLETGSFDWESLSHGQSWLWTTRIALDLRGPSCYTLSLADGMSAQVDPCTSTVLRCKRVGLSVFPDYSGSRDPGPSPWGSTSLVGALEG